MALIVPTIAEVVPKNFPWIHPCQNALQTAQYVQGKYSQVSIKRANSLNPYGMVLSELARLMET